jgi:hypothetical protein
MTTIYFATNHASAIPLMQAAYRGEAALPLGYIDTPNQGNRLPEDVLWCADNGRFSCKDWTEARWWSFLVKHAYAADRCAFATAPDVVYQIPDPDHPGKTIPVGDFAATLELSRKWFGRIRELGYQVAFVAQDGWDPSVIPWDEFDVLFVGGSDEFKLGPDGAAAIAEARAHGKWVHMGRVNSALRMGIAAQRGCDSADGSCLRAGAVKGGINVNLHKMLSWIGDEATVSGALRHAGLEEVSVETAHGIEIGHRRAHQNEYALAA